MTSTRTLSSLRHLCSLGLPAELLLPPFMAILDEAVSSDIHSFVWHGPELQPLKLFTDAREVSSRANDIQEFLASLKVRTETWHEVKAAALAGSPHALLNEIFSFFENEIRQPLGMPHEVVRFLPIAAGRPGSVYLWRSGRKGYTPDESAFLESVLGYLSYALATPTATDMAPMIDEGSSGVVLLDSRGTLLQADEIAERLLPRAIDATFGVSFREDPTLSALWRTLCHKLTLLTEGRSVSPPQESLRNPWGVFTFRSSWLQRPGAGCSGLVAATVTLRVPRKLKLWRAIHALRLPPRQQEVALLFAEGMSQNDIALQLNVARTTVIDHIRRLYDRLGIPPDRDALRAHLLDDATCR